MRGGRGGNSHNSFMDALCAEGNHSCDVGTYAVQNDDKDDINDDQINVNHFAWLSPLKLTTELLPITLIRLHCAYCKTSHTFKVIFVRG